MVGGGTGVRSAVRLVAVALDRRSRLILLLLITFIAIMIVITITMILKLLIILIIMIIIHRESAMTAARELSGLPAGQGLGGTPSTKRET